ncbi:hypothetical protein HPB52_021321 [Rhipicephalus sanguineus]|uniref:Uncharacterized protein n=1 Tax=Rhipicephalus sanguineus TaxID=34632 RepID=A0A9D4PEP6_RHISA|nr:hypothetical protein HPB52_021321 [Rhipicephalus sanguineus]
MSTERMFALVRFLDAFDKKEYVVPASNVKDFHPRNDQDFSNNKVYTTFWIEEENPEYNGSYPSQVLLLAIDSQVATQQAFADIGGGRYHVANGFCIGSKQAQKIMAQKKPSLVAKDMAQAIWGRKALAHRTYGGKLAPKDYKNPDATVRKQLSPEKVALIISTPGTSQLTLARAPLAWLTGGRKPGLVHGRRRKR